jgi:uncharacterized protein (TIGR02594 family)
MYAACPSDFTPFPWMEWAFLALGHGVRQGRDRPFIHDFLRYAGKSDDKDHPWCSAFVNYCMEQAGIRGTRNAYARSWVNWGAGRLLTVPKFGCVVVFWQNDPDPAKDKHGHVGFYTGIHRDRPLVLGGNQHHAISVGTPYPKNHILGYRWPLQLPSHP